MYDLKIFEGPERLAEGLSQSVAAALQSVIEKKGEASILVSGGTTPIPFFAALSRADIDWRKVTVSLVDERDVPETSERSNARMVKEKLLRSRAASAAFRPLRGGDPLSPPFDAVILGMGEDGHVASLFPGGSGLAAALDPEGAAEVIETRAPGAPEPRLTYTLAALLETGLLVLHIEGGAKRATLQKALESGPEAELPVRALLRQSRCSLQIYWCP